MSEKTKKHIQKMDVPDDIAQLIMSIFDNSEQGELWLNTPINALNHETPISRLNTHKGVEDVIKVLNKIMYGDFS